MFEDSASAKSLAGRDSLKQALALVDTGRVDGLLVTKLDRLTRSVRDLCCLVERYFSREARLLSVAESIDTASASGRMLINLLAVVSQWERETISERTKEALEHRRNLGLHVAGSVPFGWRKRANGILEADPDEAPIIERIWRLRERGCSCRRIAERLNAENVPARGARWHANTVARVCRRKKDTTQPAKRGGQEDDE